MRSAAIVVTAAVLAACAAEPAEEMDEPAPRATETKGAPIPEAVAEPSEERDGGAPEAAPAVLVATFEPASADCNGWSAEGARSIRSVPARGGTYACKLCADGSQPEIAIAREAGSLVAGRYALRAWIRKRPQNAAPVSVSASLEASTVAGALAVEAPSVTVREEWDLLAATLDLPDGASALRVRIAAPVASADECVLIDDVSVEPR